MTTGLARASVRARPSAFGGVFAVLTLSATVVTASVAMVRTASGAPPSAHREDLTTMGLGFTLVTVYLSVFVIGQVMALSVAQRARENALLRAVGASPWQVRRMVAAEALLTALIAWPVGYGLGTALARVWCDGMAGQGMLPAGTRLVVGWPPALAAAGVLAVTAQLGGLLAAHRAARSRPAAALGEAEAPRSGVTVVRLGMAVAALAGAVALTAVTAAGPADETAERLPLVLFAYLAAVGLAGPAIGRLATGVAALVLRALGNGVVGELAVANGRALARRWSSAVTPVAMVVAFALVRFAALARTGTPAWMDVFATALYAGFASLVAANTVVMLTAERRREVALLWAVGTGAGQVVRMVLLEGAIVALTGFGAGAAVACAVTLPLGAAAGAPLSALPVAAWAATGGGVLLLVLGSAAVPLGRLLRGRRGVVV
ncbi:ABC transporter permease [Streptomyces sp. NPDC003077]|uniref:ABC transporter permease n=1 Tax=Streptomyces sp. NPDC003077 TaxID=3154443 RepID=UPI0033B680C7